MVDLTGEWFLQMIGPQGLVHITLKLVQEGSTLRGTAEGPMGDAEIAGSVDGESFSFSLSVDTGAGFVMRFSGTHVSDEQGDRLSGTMRAGEVTAEFSAERVERA